jgi:hypothetical protein
MSKKAKVATIIPEEEVPEVLALHQVETHLKEFIEENSAFYEKFTQLVNDRNKCLKEAETVVRGLGVTCGPFCKISEGTKINTEKLFEELGDETFKELGGYTETVIDYKIDRARFLAYLESGMVPQEIADACVKTEVRYKAPDPYKIP